MAVEVDGEGWIPSGKCFPGIRQATNGFLSGRVFPEGSRKLMWSAGDL